MSLTQIELVRLNIGDTTVPYDLTDAQIQYALDKYPVPPNTESYQVWAASIQCLVWLKSMYASEAYRQRERVGQVEKEAYGNERYQAICDLLDWFEKNPPSDGTASKIGGFRFGSSAKSIPVKIGMFDCCSDDIPSCSSCGAVQCHC